MAPRKDKKTVLSALLLWMMLLSVCLAQTARLAVQQKRAKALGLVDKYAQALDSTASFIEHYERTGEYRGCYPPSHPYYAYHGGKAFRYQVPLRGVFKFKENKGWYKSDYRWGYFNPEHKNVPEDKPIYILRVTSMDISYFHQVYKNRSPLGSGTWVKMTRRTLEPPDCVVGISHLLGYVDTDERLDEVLRKAKYISVRDRTEIVRGSACVVIDAHTRYGQFSLWLDPSHGYHAARIRRKAAEGEYTHHHIIPRGSIATGYLDVLEFKKVDDTWVPVDANAGFHRTMGSPAYYMDEDHRYKRTQIILNPDHDKLGSFADPIFEEPDNDPELVNGTSFKIDMGERERGGKYTWRDGKLIDENGREVDMDKLKARARTVDFEEL